jgi:hypothetical protein
MLVLLRRPEHADISPVHLLAGPRVLGHVLHGAKQISPSYSLFQFDDSNIISPQSSSTQLKAAFMSLCSFSQFLVSLASLKSWRSLSY